MTNEELRANIEDIMDEMSDEEIIELHNSVADDYSSEDKIFSMDDFDEIIDEYFSYTPTDLIEAVLNSDHFDLQDAYFTVTDRQDIVSFTDLLDPNCPWDREACIDGILEYDEGYGNPDIELVLEQAREEEE